MRFINLSPEPGMLAHNAMEALDVYAAYPEDDESRRQAMMLLADEFARWQSMEGVGYAPTVLTQTILEAIFRQVARRTVAGYVAVAIEGLLNAGVPATVERASRVVSEFAYSTKAIPHTFWREGKAVEQAKKIPGEVSEIKKIFREYRSVAHICAAHLVTTDYLEFPRYFEPRPEADACYIATTLYYQQRLQDAQNFRSWNLWHIDVQPPDLLSTFPPLLPDPLLFDCLFGPWHDKEGWKDLKKYRHPPSESLDRVKREHPNSH